MGAESMLRVCCRGKTCCCTGLRCSWPGALESPCLSSSFEFGVQNAEDRDPFRAGRVGSKA